MFLSVLIRFSHKKEGLSSKAYVIIYEYFAKIAVTSMIFIKKNMKKSFLKYFIILDTKNKNNGSDRRRGNEAIEIF